MKNFKLLLTIIVVLLSSAKVFGEIIWQDGFESPTGWILSGEFEIGMPMGLGGDHGNPDPSSAYTGFSVLGVDLSGLGNYPGDYETNLGLHEYSAVSPVIDCSEFDNIQLSFMQWLNVEQPAYDHAYISISLDDGISWVDIWTNTTVVEDNSWSEINFDLSDFADLQAGLRLRFSIGPTDGSWQYSGWNIDELVVSGDPVVYGSIEGNVMNAANNQPVAFAQVFCPFANALTDEDGYFLVNGIPSGERILNVFALGFFQFETNVVVMENDTIYVLCELLENPDTPPPPLNLQAVIIDFNNVQLDWDEPLDRDLLLAYNIYRNHFLLQSTTANEYYDADLVYGNYEYFVTAVYDIGESLPSNSVQIEIEAVNHDNNEIILGNEFNLRNFPNPFNPSTTISFNISNESSFAKSSGLTGENEQIQLVIYNLKGQKIKNFTFSNGSAGTSDPNHQITQSTNQQIIWNGDDNKGKPVSSGIYYYRLIIGNSTEIRKMLLLK